MPTRAGDPASTSVEALLHSGALRAVFQPIVDLDTAGVVAYEALTRGPAGRLNDPLALLASARDEGLLPELDDACRSTAVRAVLGQQRSPTTIFLNAEPEAFTAAPGAAAWEALAQVIAAARPHLHVVLEITERDIPARPATLLRTVDRVRELGWGIALDDVGVSAASLAFMPLLAPDVVKLDAALVQRRPSADTGQVAHAVNDYAERSGALVLAEGIETARHLATARALGARLGQGWLFGHPGERLVTDRYPGGPAPRNGAEPLPDLLARRRPAPRPRSTGSPASTPFTALSGDVVLRRRRRRC